VLQQHLDDGMLVRQAFEHFLAGRSLTPGGLLGRFQAQLAEKKFGDLLGRSEIERSPGERMGFLLEHTQLGFELAGLDGKHLGIDRHPRRAPWPPAPARAALDVAIDALEPGFGSEFGREHLEEPPSEVRVLGGIGRARAGGTSSKPICFLPLPHSSA